MKRRIDKKKVAIFAIITAALIAAIVVLIVVLVNRPKPKTAKKEKTKTTKQVETTIEPETTTEPAGPQITEAGGITYVNGILIANKKHSLPADYYPGEDPTAVDALWRLIGDAQAEGLDIGNSYSGFRSYDTQSSIYWSYVEQDGQAEADTYSARPGYSEHQTGLAYDLKNWDGALVESEPEATWISENAHKYGFIVRYKADKQDITGYKGEPWHLRYVGDIATDIYNSGLCLEEYLGVEGGDYVDN